MASVVVTALALAGCSTAEPVDIEASVVNVSLTSCADGSENRATAALIDEGLLLTAAHSFADARELSITTADGAPVAARLVHLDVERDLALVAIDGSASPTSTLELRDDGDDPADTARVVVFREGRVVTEPLDLLRRTEVTLDGVGRRQGIELGGVIEPGDSGAPIVDPSGRMIGMVFASSRNDDTGWAVAGSELVDIAARAADPLALSC